VALPSVLIAESAIRQTLRAVCAGLATSRDRTNVEVSGLLLGKQIVDDLFITSAVAGDQISGEFGSELARDFIAAIAQSVLTGNRKDRIVGMFHSHPGFGVFMSQQDVLTLANFQKLYPGSVMMVIDPLKKLRYKFFTYDAAAGSVRVLPVQVVR
jgi:proteasome lid subunit RPN8/RPN11